MSSLQTGKKPWYERIPNTFVILFALIVFAAVLTWVVPAGEFERVTGADGRLLIQPGTYHAVDQEPASLFDIFLSISKGLQGSANIIFMILLSSGAFKVINSTGALENSIGVMLRAINRSRVSSTAVPKFRSPSPSSASPLPWAWATTLSWVLP